MKDKGASKLLEVLPSVRARTYPGDTDGLWMVRDQLSASNAEVIAFQSVSAGTGATIVTSCFDTG